VLHELMPNHSCERTPIKPVVRSPEPHRRRSIHRSAGIAGFGFARAVREVREARAPQTTVAVWSVAAGTDCTDLPTIPQRFRGQMRGDVCEVEVEVLGSAAFDDLPNHALERTAIKPLAGGSEPLRRRSACR